MTRDISTVDRRRDGRQPIGTIKSIVISNDPMDEIPTGKDALRFEFDKV